MNKIWIFDGFSLYDKEDEDIEELYSLTSLMKENFKLIEENTIDIEELEETTILDSFISTEHEIRDIKNKSNEIIRYLKQLDQRIEKLEENQ